MHFGNKLKELRLLRDISLRKLGEKAGISYSVLVAIESGRSQPSRDHVLAIAYALKCDRVDELLAAAQFGEEDERKQPQ